MNIKGLIKGKSVKESAKDVRSTFTVVQEENRKKFKENIRRSSEQIDKLGGWQYLLGPAILSIKAADKVLNK